MRLPSPLRIVTDRLQACEVGDKTDNHLTPTKMAAFYKAVGGDYDRAPSSPRPCEALANPA